MRPWFCLQSPTFEVLGSIYATDTSHHPLDTQKTNAEKHERRADCKTLVGDLLALSGERGASLDVGCGDGAFSWHLAKHGFKVEMIDLDPRARAVAQLVPGSTFHLCSFEVFTDEAASESPPRRFSAIVMSQVLEHALARSIGFSERARR